MDLDRLIQLSKSRWFKPSEVFQILRFYPSSGLSFNKTFQQPPASGELYLIYKPEFKRWKQDGHFYVQRRNGSGVREDREKYRDELEVIQCTYVHGAGVCSSCKCHGEFFCSNCGLMVTASTFHRRAYWRVNDPDIILVHYLNDSLRETAASEEESTTISVSSESSSYMNYEPDEQIRRLEEALMNLDADDHQNVEITEYAPDWDFREGGAKVIICVEPPIMVPYPALLSCHFGENTVQIECIQLGVLRCYAPPNNTDKVDIAIYYDQKQITVSSRPFYYKDIEIVLNHQIKGSVTNSYSYNSAAQIYENDLHAQISHDHEELMDYSDEIFGYSFSQNNKNLPKILHNLSSSTIQNDFESHVKLIQRTVRMWLRRRKTHEIQRAVKTLQRGDIYLAIRTLHARKQFKDQRKAAILIQKTVRAWLTTLHSPKGCRGNERVL